MTISFGHGLSVAPLQSVMGVAALMNGGYLIPPTFLKRSQSDAMALAKRVVKPETSAAMRYLMRLNAEKGTATKADVKGFYVGGKTGTAEKVVNGRYSKNRLMTDFMAVLPADQPRYLMLIMLDEPQADPGDPRFRDLGLERGAGRREGDRAHRAAARHGAALRPAAGRPLAARFRERVAVKKRSGPPVRWGTYQRGPMKLGELLNGRPGSSRGSARSISPAFPPTAAR